MLPKSIQMIKKETDMDADCVLINFDTFKIHYRSSMNDLFFENIGLQPHLRVFLSHKAKS